MKNKYNAQSVYFSETLQREMLPNEITYHLNRQVFLTESVQLGNVIKFDSRLEFKVYKSLLSSPLNYQITPHFSLQLLPSKQSKCFPNGKNWKVDFLAERNNQEQVIIETKGVITREFPFILAMLERNNPEMFSKLWLVFERIPKSNRFIKTLLKSNAPKILTLKQFQKLIN